MTALSMYKAEAMGAGWNSEAPSKAIILISVGRDYHEGGKLLAAVDFVNRNFATAEWMIADLLQRHNLAAQGLSSESAISAAFNSGDEWLKRNAAIIDAVTVPAAHKRWRDYMQMPEFKETLAQYHALAKTNIEFQGRLLKDADGFIQRKLRRSEISENDVERYREASIVYILEELAIYTIVGRGHKYTMVYPGAELSCIEYVRTAQIQGAPIGLAGCKFLALHLRKRPSGVAKDAQFLLQRRREG